MWERERPEDRSRLLPVAPVLSSSSLAGSVSALAATQEGQGATPSGRSRSFSPGPAWPAASQGPPPLPGVGRASPVADLREPVAVWAEARSPERLRLARAGAASPCSRWPSADGCSSPRQWGAASLAGGRTTASLDASHNELFEKILATDTAMSEPMSRSQVLARSLGRGLQVAVEARDHYAAECRRLESHLGEAQADLRAKDALHEKVHGVLQQELGALRQRSAGLEEEVARLKAQRALGGAPMQEVAQARHEAARWREQAATAEAELHKARLEAERWREQAAAAEAARAQLRYRLTKAERRAEEGERQREAEAQRKSAEDIARRRRASHAQAQPIADAHREALSLGGTLLPGSADEFVARVRQLQARAAGVLTRAYASHAALIEGEFSAPGEVGSASWSHRDDLVEASEQLACILRELNALQHECRVQRHLSAEELAATGEHLGRMRRVIEEELAEMREPTLMRGLPDDVARALREDAAVLDGGRPLLAWLHEQGRRALTHYVLRRDFGGLLDSAEAPAEAAERVAAKTPPSEPVAAPFASRTVGNVGWDDALPEHVRAAVVQTEALGWERMVWAKNVTLLHWAAREDRPGLCRRLLRLRADPAARDDAGRSPFDIAASEEVRAALLGR